MNVNNTGAEPNPALGHPRNWNVDLIPKFIMACGKLVKILLHTKVTRYLEFKSVDGSYVFKDKKVQKVPGNDIMLLLHINIISYNKLISDLIDDAATPAEALNSSLMGFFEKRKFRSFLIFLSTYEKDKPSTYFDGKPEYTTECLNDFLVLYTRKSLENYDHTLPLPATLNCLILND
jgi:Rab GDP dissociation inhibitor